MLYMIIERFRDGDPIPVYRRLRDRGRMAPEGLRYVSSWVAQDLASCFQLMETADPDLLAGWMESWKDVADFEVVPVVTSVEAQATVGPRL